ncbi:MAG: MFS transporter [Calditrichaeota bacterium]|jgi:MFS transporter, UMF1 family|nr:MFS transporter [Calditrichota bacterium]MBT7616496.1 MFS transporter [Calditrichota bacterium]MBT7788009.1 MFS transporter [Calditrichota bacterium]
MIIKNRSTLGWILYDFANSSFATIVLAVIFNQYYAEVIAGGKEGIEINTPLFKLHFEGAVLWSYLVAFSTAIVAITSPLLGAMADQAHRRKRMLLVYCYLGVAGTICLSFANSGDILFASFFFILANLGFAGGNVFYNAFLLDVSSRKSFGMISGLSWGLGYLGGGLCLLLNLIMLKNPQLLGFPEGYFTVGDCMIVAGIWWGVFAIPTMIWLKDKPVVNPVLSLRKLTRVGWERIGNTIREIRKYKQLVRFLIAYLIFNDGIETIIIMASIFGAQVVGLETKELITFFIIIQATGFVGSLLIGWISDKIGNKRTLLISLSVWLVIVAWAYKIGWLFDARQDFLIIGILTGFVMGGSQTVSRAMQAAFTPKDRSAEFFGFYAVSGRFASVLGPLVYGTVIMLTGGVQKAILSIGAFFLIGGIVLWFVDEKEGIRENSVGLE